MNEKANYGNWVPEKALHMLFGAAVLLGVIAVLAQTVQTCGHGSIRRAWRSGTCHGCLHADLP